MRIGIDAHSLKANRTGIGNYLYFNLKQMIKTHPNDIFYLFSNDVFDEFKNISNVKFILNSHLSKFFRGKIWITYFKFLFSSYNIDVFWSPNFIVPFWLSKKIKVIVTVHDLSHKSFSDFVNRKTKLNFKINLCRSLKRADKVIAISEFTKSEIIKYYNWINPKKIIVNYCGYDPKNMLVDLSLNDQLIHEIYNIKSKFILALSSLVSRKNTITILKAYKELLNSNNNYKLVLVGKKDNDTDLLSTYIKENNLVDKIIFTGYVPNNHIGWFYNNCEVYVSASLYEGFGIPNIEAYGVSKRVILSDIPVYREIFGDLVFYFKPLDYIGLCNLLKESNSKRKDSKFLQKFKWENISQKTYEILKI
jgi:hypothetical protein